MRAFIDTNVFMEFYSGRTLCEEAAKILSLAQDRRLDAVTSILCVSDIIYLFEKYKLVPKSMIPSAIRDLSSAVIVLPVGKEELEDVLSMEYSRDMEDALEISCAARNGCDVIVTINKKDFACSSVPALTPAEFLAIAPGNQGCG